MIFIVLSSYIAYIGRGAGERGQDRIGHGERSLGSGGRTVPGLHEQPLDL